MSSATTPSGWYPDPEYPGHERWWDGTAWSDARRPAGGVAAPAPPAPFPAAGLAPGPAGILVPAGTQVSSAGRRLGSYLLDGLLAVVTLAIGWLIWSLVVWGKGTTPGKSLLGMKVVRTDTGRLATWGQMCLRELVGKSLLGSVTFGITTIVSCFMILGQSRQGVWDRIATTIVVDDPNKVLG